MHPSSISIVNMILIFHKPLLPEVLQKCGPNRLSRFDVYWIQTSQHADRKAKYIHRRVYWRFRKIQANVSPLQYIHLSLQLIYIYPWNNTFPISDFCLSIRRCSAVLSLFMEQGSGRMFSLLYPQNLTQGIRDYSDRIIQVV